MQVKDFADKYCFDLLSGEGKCEFKDCYCGDVLQRIKENAKPDSVWITVNTNKTCIETALLTGVACIVLAENVTLDSNTIDFAKSKNVTVLRTEKSAFEIARLVAIELKIV